MHQLAIFAREQRYKTSGDSLQATCASARHHIGRLGLHARSAKALASYTHRMMAFLESYSVQAVPIPVKGHGRPPPRKATNVEAALGRMLPANSPELEMYRQTLSLMDEPCKISERFLKSYSNSKNQARVHAEVKNLQKVTSTSRVASLRASVATSTSAITQVGSSNPIPTIRFTSTGSYRAWKVPKSERKTS
jgi:hypothetical protein